MQSSSQCSYGLRNPFAAPTHAIPSDVIPANHHPAASYDFQQMLNQNMSMDVGHVSSGHANTLLGSIQEDGDETSGPKRDIQTSVGRGGGGLFDRTNQSMLGASMGASIKGGMSRREGPVDGSHEGLLHSVFQADSIETAHPTDLTAADMCLSTLYLHELHHRQIRRRGVTTDQRCRQMWQRPHQQPLSTHTDFPGSSSSMISSPTPFASASFVGGSTTSVASAVENTPLLSAKKS